MPDLPALPSTPTGRYRHYRGGEYEVIGVARHSETLEPLVVYRPLYNDSGLWVRPHAMFFGHVLVDGRPRPRFERIEAERPRPLVRFVVAAIRRALVLRALLALRQHLALAHCRRASVFPACQFHLLAARPSRAAEASNQRTR